MTDTRIAPSRPIATLRRRWLLVAIGAAVGLVVGLAGTLGKQTLYSAKSEVFFSRINFRSSITGTPDATAYADAETTAATEAQLARVTTVVRRTLDAVGERSSVSDFLGRARVAPLDAAPNILRFAVDDSSPIRAQQLVNAWADTATRYRQSLDTRAISAAIVQVDSSIAQLEQGRAAGSALYQSLIDNKQQLETMKTLQGENGTVVQRADSAAATGRSTVQTSALAVLAGALIGMALAFAWEMFFPPAAALDAATVLPAAEASRKRKELVG
jgi:uncharacterized protein involved in exopolysaccharide biosynthesis